MPSAEPPQQMLTVTGRVLLPDGSPAANAIVSALGNQFEHGLAVRADVAGRFRLSHKFGWYQRIHARTADWRQQAWSPIAPDAVRIMSEKSLELTLAPTQEHRVLVTSGGKPAQGVYLAAYGSAKAQTGPDGMASLWLPATDRFRDRRLAPEIGRFRTGHFERRGQRSDENDQVGAAGPQTADDPGRRSEYVALPSPAPTLFRRDHRDWPPQLGHDSRHRRSGHRDRLARRSRGSLAAGRVHRRLESAELSDRGSRTGRRTERPRTSAMARSRSPTSRVCAR